MTRMNITQRENNIPISHKLLTHSRNFREIMMVVVPDHLVHTTVSLIKASLQSEKNGIEEESNPDNVQVLITDCIEEFNIGTFFPNQVYDNERDSGYSSE
jgi:hypothetical protein